MVFSELKEGMITDMSGDAMNKGIDAAKGAWIYFMGSDDELLNDTVLSTVAPFLQKTDSVFVYGNVLMGDSKHWYDGEFTYEKLLQRNISHQAIFYNKKVVDQAGKYIIRYKTHADWAYNITCFRNKNIHPEYMNVLVARFGLEGVSSQHDVVFLREFLLPARLAYLQEAGVKHLKKISFYDGLWRLFRNAGINTKQQLVEYAANLPVPVPVISMVKVQNKIPAALLKTGVVSKGLMFLNYIFNRITGKL